MTTERSVPGQPGHLGGIDSLRFLCALAVMLGHLHPLPDLLHGDGLPLPQQALVTVFNGVTNGPAAVIVFFVISGFCIHFPYRRDRSLDLAPYLSRRMVRILLPAAAHLLLLWYALGYHDSLLETMLWSVLCEVIYYALYPALLALRRRSHWGWLVGAAALAAACLIATHLPELHADGNQYTALGYSTWIIGLPCWLLGCWLAEELPRFAVPNRAGVWRSRTALLAAFVVTHTLQSHGSSPLSSNCVTLDLFAPLAAWCLAREILWSRRAGTLHWLERAGRWSYSLYLVHPLVLPALVALGFGTFARSGRAHPLVLALVLLLSYGFFRLVELPSHRLAIALSRKLQRRASPAST